MPAKILDGKLIAENLKDKIKKEVVCYTRRPGLAVLLIGGNASSKLYVKLKKKAAHFCGLDFHKYIFDKDTSEQEILECLEFLNKDPEIDGIIIQLPLPARYDTEKIIETLNPLKDADGFHPQNLNKLKSGQPYILSPLALGVKKLIEATETSLKNKKALVLANSDFLFKPLRFLLKPAKTEYADIKDKKLYDKIKQADILVTALGKENFIQKEMVKKDAILIDCGIIKNKNGISGDIDSATDEIAGWRSPVPGGVGPLTVVYLLKNTLELQQKQLQN